MIKIIIFYALIAISASAPSSLSVSLVEPTTILGRVEPQPEAPASTEHGKLIPALRYSSLLEPVPRLSSFEDPLFTSFVASPYARPFEAHSYRISY